MSGQYRDPVRVVAFDTAELWSEDTPEDISREIMRRLDFAGQDPMFPHIAKPPKSTRSFGEQKDCHRMEPHRLAGAAADLGDKICVATAI